MLTSAAFMMVGVADMYRRWAYLKGTHTPIGLCAGPLVASLSSLLCNMLPLLLRSDWSDGGSELQRHRCVER